MKKLLFIVMTTLTVAPVEAVVAKKITLTEKIPNITSAMPSLKK